MNLTAQQLDPKRPEEKKLSDEKSSGNWTIPNMLSLFRLALIPAFVVFFLEEEYLYSFLTFITASITDALDGIIARWWNQKTTLGAILDPLADKLLLMTSFIVLAATGWLPVWLTVITITRDTIIMGGLAVIVLAGVDMRRKIRPTAVSKVNTFAQMLLILSTLCVMIFGWKFTTFITVLIYSVTILTIVSGLDYIRQGLSLFPNGNNGR